MLCALFGQLSVSPALISPQPQMKTVTPHTSHIIVSISMFLHILHFCEHIVIEELPI